ncbi:DUF502 domain-containing protein [Chloroflexota bacterium]
MKYTHWISWRWLGKKLRGQFLTGVVTVVPVGATILILIWIFTSIDNILQPVIRPIWGHTITGVGFGVTIVLIYLVGVLASNVAGKRLIHYGESVLPWMPGFRQLYNGIKQVLLSFSEPRKAGFMQVVLMEFPRKGIWSVGFITNELSAQSGETRLNVFIPTAPNPTSGFLQIAKEDEVIRTDISIEQALRMVMSAGRVSPEGIADKLSERMG